ncbi:SDR family oxidoreductase [Brooklawnia cerclae]|uniref:2-deoxy-D-gluconate 3-dehydrogenase n=1 Tax=Brooklawnia cerclae TaxID=349934 RepID=A0ABX0SJK0_9ACTN|nr:SDR family oxidoreductase [Brooklawnia cerclae]NIH58094.1 2-deoxy-D-gluconate 3-dehydrogenase [Brooklawnia cerclae]
MSSPFDISGQTAVVTGGARGLGRGAVEALLRAGADVHVIDRLEAPDDLRAFAAEQGRRLVGHQADLLDPDALPGVAREILADDQIDILVSNAGFNVRYPSTEFPLDKWDAVLAVDLRAVFQGCQLFGAPMVERGHGKIINTASVLSFQGGLTVPAYAAAKGGVASVTRALCNEWAGRGVNVNAIAPGYMATELNTQLLADEERTAQITVRIPAGRWGTPADVGDVVVFLASPAADYIHGQVIAIDGGWLAR